MFIKDDLDEAKKLWGKASWSMRAIIALSMWLSISSLASLSDNIIQWRGLIRDAIQFYHTFVSNPLSDLGNWLGIHLGQYAVDNGIILYIIVASLLRVSLPPNRIAMISGHAIMAVLIFAMGAYIHGDFKAPITWVEFLPLLSFICVTLWVYRNHPEKRIKILSVPVVAIAIVLAAASIHVGFTSAIP